MASSSLQISSWHGHAELADDGIEEAIEEAVASDDEIGTSHVPQTLLHAPQRGSQQLLRAADFMQESLRTQADCAAEFAKDPTRAGTPLSKLTPLCRG